MAPVPPDPAPPPPTEPLRHAGAGTAGLPDGRWRLRLLGAVELRLGEQPPMRWPSRAAAELVARLALAPQRTFPREELVELLWPGVSLDVGRNRLRQALSTLRRLLEDAGGPSLIDADRLHLRLQPEALWCDAVEFQAQARAGDRAAAHALWGGDLMPGHYHDWVLDERGHLAALHDRLGPAPLAPAAVPPVHARPADAPLPAAWTRVFGIEHSATRLLTLLRHERLVTVTGPGGAGKTRLVVEVARALRDPPAWAPAPAEAGLVPARIVYVPLVDCRDAADTLAALALALRTSGRDLMAQIVQRLAEAPTLLVLDNVEQLVGHVRGLVMQLLEAVPSLRLLLTTRLRLGLPGEQVHTLRGLPTPDSAPAADPATLLLSPAVALFVDRARAVRPDFQPVGDELAAVCELVRRLDGLPLALELAASRLASHSAAQLLHRLHDPQGRPAQLSLLRSGARRAAHDPRQSSMADVVGWSWGLLAPAEQDTLAAVCAFAGDAGASGVAALLGDDEAGVAARLDDLVAHSMLRVVPAAGDEPRLAVLEPVREFVRSQRPADEPARHRQAMLTWLRAWVRGLGPAVASAAGDAEVRSVHAVLADDTLDPLERLDLALALRLNLESSGLPLPQQDALSRALAGLDTSSPERQRLASACHHLMASLRFEAGFAAEAAAHADEALRLAGDDPSRRAHALAHRCSIALAGARRTDDDGSGVERLRRELHEALTLAQHCGDVEAQARVLHQQAALIRTFGTDNAAAEQLLARSQALWVQLGNRRKASGRLRNRAQCWIELGRRDEALACFERCEAEAQADGDLLGQIDSLLSWSTLLTGLRRWQEALALDRRCASLCWQHWHRHGLAYALWNVPLSLVHLRRPEAALPLMAFAAEHWQRHFGPLSPGDRRTLQRVQRLGRAQLGRPRAEALWRQGQSMPIAQAVGLALGG